MPTIRLDRLVAVAGSYTKSEAVMLIKHGHITVDGCVALSRSEKYSTDTARIAIDGEPLEYREFRYVMLNKPQGYITATEDKYEKTVIELLSEKYAGMGLFPVGRLDKDADGLLILTNDGKYSHKVISPSSKVRKRYFVQFDGKISASDIESFDKGVVLADGTRCLPALLEPAPGGAFVSLHEGKYHQVKRMMAAIEKPVKKLTRVSIGGLSLDESLKPGEFRELFEEASLVFSEINTQNNNK